MTPRSSALPRQTQEADGSPSAAADPPRHSQGVALHRSPRAEGCAGSVDHQPPSAHDAVPHHPQDGGDQASQTRGTGCPLSSAQESSEGATHAGEQRCRAGWRCARRGDDAPVPDAGVLRPLAGGHCWRWPPMCTPPGSTRSRRELGAGLWLADATSGGSVGGSFGGSSQGSNVAPLTEDRVWRRVSAGQVRLPPASGQPRLYGGVFMNSYRSLPRQGRSRRITAAVSARRGVLAHRSGSGHPSSHPLASGAHLQPGLSHVLHGSQYRPASDDPSLRAAPRGALSTAASRSGERVPLRPRSPRCLDRRQYDEQRHRHRGAAPVAHGPSPRHRHQPAPGPHSRDQRCLRPSHRCGPESSRRQAGRRGGASATAPASSAKSCVPTGSGCGERRGRVTFCLEYDRGTESLARLGAKAADYARLESAWARPSGCSSSCLVLAARPAPGRPWRATAWRWRRPRRQAHAGPTRPTGRPSSPTLLASGLPSWLTGPARRLQRPALPTGLTLRRRVNQHTMPGDGPTRGGGLCTGTWTERSWMGSRP